jgi:SAM-dependent methyltransferase
LPHHIPKVERVLEIGVGDGRNLSQLTTLGNHVIGVDISSKAVKRVSSSKGEVDLELHTCSGYALPIADESCGVVVATDLINHLDNPVQLCSEIWRVLSRGGRFFGNAISTNDPSRTAAALRGKTISGKQFSIAWKSVPNEDPVWLTMRYYNAIGLNRLFRDFRWIEPPTEYEREDLGHPPPFDSQPHRHVFWRILVQKP